MQRGFFVFESLSYSYYTQVIFLIQENAMIRTSIFELFKIGPGPSSSHTVGPMLMGGKFREEVIAFTHREHVIDDLEINVELLGSLSATGIGHGTHRAILSGLLGEEPTTVDIKKLNSFFEEGENHYEIPFELFEIDFKETHFRFNYGVNPYKHPNTAKFQLFAKGKKVLESVFYSIGGGFIEEEGASLVVDLSKQPKYNYSSMDEFESLVKETKLDPIEILFENEHLVSGFSQKQIEDKIDHIIDVMDDSVERGLSVTGTLPGGLNVERRAKGLYRKALDQDLQNDQMNSHFSKLNAYALAVSEENAAGHMVVTAPTNGAAGVFPAAITYLRRDRKIDPVLLRKGFVIGALIGFIVKENASISGAELGCQAEVGTATAMAAALFAYCFGGSLHQASTAAEIAMEHSLGMTCDPINGLVQVPCIERNANGVVKAYNAYLLSTARETHPLISFDQVVEVMRQTGEDLSEKYKETSTGGLATQYGWGNSPGS